jgi:hypothetical protein
MSNSLSGTFPPALCNVAALEQLNLGNNSLSGTLPPQLSQLTSLQSLHLDNNNFNGTLPAGLGQLTDMKIADFSYNRLQGDLPSELSAWSNLISLLIQHNYFEGLLPKNYSRLGRLTTFDASSNSFASRFDDFIQPLMMKESKCSVFSQPAGCYMLKDLRASNNSFHGEIGSFIVLATGLRTLDLSSNALGGSLPNVTGEVMFDLSVSSGYFRFVLIPPAWVTIDVHGNADINGTIPEDWSILSEVQLIDVRKTGISFALNTKKKNAFNFTYSHARGDITFYPSLSASCPTVQQSEVRHKMGNSSESQWIPRIPDSEIVAVRMDMACCLVSTTRRCLMLFVTNVVKMKTWILALLCSAVLTTS